MSIEIALPPATLAAEAKAARTCPLKSAPLAQADGQGRPHIMWSFAPCTPACAWYDQATGRNCLERGLSDLVALFQKAR